MTFSFLYLVVRALLGVLVRSRRGLDVKDIELLLRHELEIMRRQVARPVLKPADRALLAAAACNLPRSSRGVLLVTPRTLLRWHQALVRRKWRQTPERPGRLKLPVEVRDLVLRLAPVAHGSRRVVLAGCTTNPTGAWVTQQARNLGLDFSEQGIRFLIRDRESKYCGPSTRSSSARASVSSKRPYGRRRQTQSQSASSGRCEPSVWTGC